MSTSVQSQKISVSISPASFRFLEKYKKEKTIKRSQAVEKGLKLLEQMELAKAYAELAKDDEQEVALWDCTLLDGLEDETW